MISDPRTGQVFDLESLKSSGHAVDHLIAAVNTARSRIAEFNAFLLGARALLASLYAETCPEGAADANTFHVKGDKSSVVLERPRDSWDQSTLRELYRLPLGPEYIRVDRLAPNLVKIRSLERSSGGFAFTAFRDKLLSARTPSCQPPYIKSLDGAADDDAGE